MKTITIPLFFLISINLFAQDVIVTSNNEEILVKVEEIDIETITYKKFDNLSGPKYHIKKSSVSKIIFENGNVETFTAKTESREITLEETKAFIVENINKYCYDHNGYLRNGYKATFEGDYLRLTLYNKKQTRELSNMLYDLKNVYAFRRPDKRNDNLAYINIYLPFQKNEKKNKWEKYKLVISVEGHDKAESLVDALKHCNKLLKQKNKKPGQKF